MGKMQKTVREWAEISKYDIRTAEAMLKTKRFLYVAFMCQQAIEKVLKAVYVQEKGELPPRTHNLLYLVDALGVSLKEKELTFLSRLNQFYIESRYPGDRVKLAAAMDKKRTGKMLNETREVWECLKLMLR